MPGEFEHLHKSDEEIRGLLIAAAVECFAAQGYDPTTVWAIATKAGVSPRSLYRVFESKKALFIAAYDHTYSEFFVHLAEAFHGSFEVPPGGLKEWMDLVIDTLTEFVTGDPVVGAFLALAPIDMARSPDLKSDEIVYNDPQHRMYSVVTGMVEALASTGRLHPDASPPAVAHLVLAVLLGANLFMNVFLVADPTELKTALKLFAAGSLFGD